MSSGWQGRFLASKSSSPIREDGPDYQGDPYTDAGQRVNELVDDQAQVPPYSPPLPEYELTEHETKLEQHAERLNQAPHAGSGSCRLSPTWTRSRQGKVFYTHETHGLTRKGEREIEIEREKERVRERERRNELWRRKPNSKVALLTGFDLEVTVQPDALDLFVAVDSLLNDEPIEEVDLSDRALGNDGLEKLCTAAAQHETVKILRLSTNGITDSGVRNLAVALIRNTSITTIDLTHNKINTAGLESLVLMLGGVDGFAQPRNTTLREIKLDGNPAFATSELDTSARQAEIMKNCALRERIDTLMRNHALGVMGDDNQLEKDIERVKTDHGLKQYLEELKQNGLTAIPPAVLAGLSPEERVSVSQKALAVREYELSQLENTVHHVAHQEAVVGTQARSHKQLANANETLVQDASAKVAELQAQLHAAMLDEEALLQQQLDIERSVGENRNHESELAKQRQAAESTKQWVGQSVQEMSSDLGGI